MAVRSPSLDPMLTIHGAGPQHRESATSVSPAQMASRWISYSLGKRGDAHDSLQRRLPDMDGPAGRLGQRLWTSSHCVIPLAMTLTLAVIARRLLFVLAKADRLLVRPAVVVVVTGRSPLNPSAALPGLVNQK